MRRIDKKISDREVIDAIIKKSQVCRIAMAKDNTPYLVPVSFGYDRKTLYLHTAKEGKKIDHFLSNNKVCFEFDTNVKTIEHESIPCKWTTAYQSVIGFGKIIEVTDLEEAKYALNQIMVQYSGKEWEVLDKMFNSVKIWKIEINELTGKESNMKVL